MTSKNLHANETNSDAFMLASYTCTTGIRSDRSAIKGAKEATTGDVHQHAQKA